MAPEDREKTAFITQWGTYCYQVMPFGLKNAGATYQRAATTILHDMIHKEVEVYVDDMIVKSQDRPGHLPALKKFFERIREYRVRLNPKKCTFGVTAGKLLGFLVSNRGIEVDPSKIKAILEMQPPKTEKEVRGFLGRIQYISRFISQLTSTCEPIFKLLRKTGFQEWDEKCQQAFEQIKEYLMKPPILMPPRPGVPFILYLDPTDTTMGAMLAQYLPESRKENAIYYLSKKMTEGEVKYSTIEKSCLALVWATRKLRHYLLTAQVWLVSRMNPLKYLFEKPALVGRTSKWLLLLSEFDITYVTQKSIKGRVIAEFLADTAPANEESTEDNFPDEGILTIENGPWEMYFDGASNEIGKGIGVLLISPEGDRTPISIKLNFNATNNIAEYEACIAGLEAAIAAGIEDLVVYGDSALIICQTKGSWQTKDEKLVPYHKYLSKLVDKFTTIEFNHVPRYLNRFADALAALASMIDIPEDTPIQPLIVEQRDKPVHCYMIQGASSRPNGVAHSLSRRSSPEGQ